MRASLGIVAAVALLVTTAQPASAYAAGNSTWGSFCWAGKCFPTGTLLHVVDGHGVALSYDRAQATTVTPLCNWWIDFDYYDNSGRRYRHVQGAAHNYCTRDGHVRIDYGMGPYEWHPGRACATLYSSAVRLTEQCHYLHP